MKRVGFWISEKKARKLNFDEFDSYCRNADIELVKLDLDRQLEEQGPFDLILHKLTDQIAKGNQGNLRAKQHVEQFQIFTRQHPEIVVLDPLENILKLLDRHEQYKFVNECDVVEENCHYFTPAFVEFTTTDLETNKKLMEENCVQYPFVCKPSVAHGSSQSHQMAIIFNEKGLQDVNPPCVAQTFINHNAALYKIFVIGNHHFIVERPSIKNFSAGETKTIFFDSHDVSKADSASFLNVTTECDLEYPIIEPDGRYLEKLASGIQQKLGLNLFGIDIIIENHTGRYAVIDINAFPGYDGVPEFFPVLLNLILDKLEKRPNQVHVHNELNNSFQRSRMMNGRNPSRTTNSGGLQAVEQTPQVDESKRDQQNKLILFTCDIAKCEEECATPPEEKMDEPKQESVPSSTDSTDTESAPH